jgi:hypothetical protein
MGRRAAGHCSVLLAVLALPALAAAQATPASPVLVGLTIDTSGSIPPADLARAKDLVLGSLPRLPKGSEVAVFAFDDESRLVQPRTSEPEPIRRAITGLKAAGRHTALHDALYDVSRELTDVSGMRRAVLLVTDGRNEESALTLEDALAPAVRARIPVYTVAIGTPDERYLRRIAKLTGGAHLAGQGATPAALAQRLGALPEPVTRRVEPSPGTPAAAASAAPAPTVPPAAASPAAPRAGAAATTLGLWAGLVAVLAGIGILAFLILRKRDQVTCPGCGRALPGPLARCEHCEREAPAPDTVIRVPRGETAPAAEEGAEADAPARSRFVPDLSPTVLERLNMTEEYLDKTVTLRERPVLVVSSGNLAGQVYDLTTESAISLGRSRANDIILTDVAVSSQHCRIRPEGEGFEVVDLKSTNGTFVNEQRVERRQLAEGDKLRVGDTTLEFRLQHRYN